MQGGYPLSGRLSNQESIFIGGRYMIAIINYPKWLDRELSDTLLQDIPGDLKFFANYQELIPYAEDVEIILNSGKADADVIRKLPNLKWISSITAGVDMYPLDLLNERGILLTNTSGVHATNIAEHVLGSMVAFSRNFVQAMHNQAEGVWKNYPVSELMDKSLLIIGSGRIGREIARKAKAFDMAVYGVRNQPGDETLENFDEVYGGKDLMAVLPGKDYVVLVVPATDATLGMMGKDQFKAMDETAVFINVGRGDTVVEQDLIKALENGEIKGASLDVFEKEPLEEISPLWSMPNVILTPHVAGLTPFYEERALGMFRENLERFQKGESLNNLVDLNRKY